MLKSFVSDFNKLIRYFNPLKLEDSEDKWSIQITDEALDNLVKLKAHLIDWNRKIKTQKIMNWS